MVGKATWYTPLCAMRNKEVTWQKLEETGWSFPKIDTTEPITFFNNPLKYQWSAEYDRFFAYTKSFPLWDQRKLKDNCQYLPDIRDNIHQQEKNKPVPVLSSFNYGLAARAPLPLCEPGTGYQRVHATGDFNRRTGVMRVIEKKPEQ